jgi:hypothetical protein
MRKDSHNRKGAAVKLQQPGSMPSGKSNWLVQVEYWLAPVERWCEPADQADYLIRRSLLGPVNWALPGRGAGSVRASAAAEFGGRRQAGAKQLFGEQLIVS